MIEESDRDIVVLDYGIGNLASAHRALVHLGANARLVRRPEDAQGAIGVVLPGVGAFGRSAEALASSGLIEVARAAVGSGVAFLGICVGLPLLFEGSEESPGIDGMGVLAGVVRRLPPGTKSPQIQWNVLRPVRGRPARMVSGLPEDPWMYFVHSYAPEVGPATVATCDYGGEITAAIEQGHVWGTQFHPEKSGTLGLGVLANFVEFAAARAGVAAL